MPTTNPRVYVTLEPGTRQLLEAISEAENSSISNVVSKLINYALGLAEDLALVERTNQRLESFRRDDAFTSSDILKWNKGRKKK